MTVDTTLLTSDERDQIERASLDFSLVHNGSVNAGRCHTIVYYTLRNTTYHDYDQVSQIVKALQSLNVMVSGQSFDLKQISPGRAPASWERDEKGGWFRPDPGSLRTWRVAVHIHSD